MNLEFLMKNKFLKEKMDIVYKKIKNKKYTEAYEDVRDLIDFINEKFILKNYNIDLNNASSIPASKVYLKNDEELFRYMVVLNDEYNTINYLDIISEDVELLISYLDCIYTYMVKNYGEFM